MKIKDRFLNQVNTGQWWGGFKALISSASSYASWTSMAMQAVVLYTVTSPVMDEKNISIPFWLFSVLIIVLAISILVFEWKVTIPSAMRFTNAQTAKHDSPIYQNTEEILAKNDMILEQNKKIMEKLGIWEEKY